MILYRCSTCDKWSHAKKKPKSHQRWVDAWSPEYDPAKNENPGYDGDSNNLADGHFVDCGPFDTYTAFKLDDADAFTDLVVQA